MQITSGKVVSIDYTLTDDSKNTIDTSTGKEPLVYLHGSGHIIPGLEEALEGKTSGEALQVRIEPEAGYGERDPKKVVVVPRDRIEGAGELKEGLQLHARGEHGEQVVTITKVEDDTVTVDANHPLAGVALNFDVTVRDVRDATKEEKEHGHVHGPGGHHHH